MLKTFQTNTRIIIKSKSKEKRCIRSHIDARVKNRWIKMRTSVKKIINRPYAIIQLINKEKNIKVLKYE
jgi:ribosomal protein L13E